MEVTEISSSPPKTSPVSSQPNQLPVAKKLTKKQKKLKNQELTNPMKILNSVLAKSSFKVANLSQIVEHKFYEAPDYHRKLCYEMKDIVYQPTVGETIDGFSDIMTTVLPIGFSGHVNLPPTVITSLSCINEQPGKRRWPRHGKKKKNKQQQRPQQQQRPNQQKVNEKTCEPTSRKSDNNSRKIN